jgi:adenylate cyclase
VLASRDLLRRCVALDPEFATGWAELARSEYHVWFFGLQGDECLEVGFEHVRRALDLDPDQPDAHLVLGLLYAMSGDASAAVPAARRALELAPGRADLRLGFASLLVHVWRTDEAIPVLKGLTRLDPALRYMHLFQLALCYRRLGRIDEAIAKHHECLAANPDFFGAHTQLAAIHAQLDEMNQARTALSDVLRLRPDFCVGWIPRVPVGREFLVENLRKAGLRE